MRHNPAYACTDPEVVRGLIVANPWATLVSGTAGLVASHCPVLLDPEAEERLFGDYNTMFREKTSILISHRLSGVKQCNRIVVLDKGAIVEQGTHDTLMNKGGLYCKLYSLQKNNYKFKEETSGKSK